MLLLRRITLKKLFMKSKLITKLSIVLALGMLVLTSCRRDEVFSPETTAESFDYKVPFEWNELFLDIDRFAPGYRPPAAARMLGYTGLAAYEAIVPGMPNNRSLVNMYAGLTIPSIDPTQEYHWPSVINAVYATMFRHAFPHVQQRFKDNIDRLERMFDDEFRNTVSTAVLERSKARGVQVANAVYEWSTTDVAGHNAYLNPHPEDYTPPVGPGLWAPTFPDFTLGLFPYWNQVRAFALRDGDRIARRPIPYSEDPNSEYYLQAKENEIIVNEMNFERLWIAEFWSDDIFEQTFEPAARWIAIANQVVEKEKVNLAVAVELYAKMGMALCDTGIAIWTSKYHYNVERPVQYIRNFLNPQWTSALNNTVDGTKGLSPPFPAYPSGHSGFGAAGAAVLTNMFGFNYKMTDKCHEFRSEFIGTPRSFNSFTDMAYENAISRIYLGVHFRMDCEEGLRMGYLAGDRVVRLPWKR